MAQNKIMRVEDSLKQVLIGHSGNLAEVSSHMQDEHGPKESAIKLVDELLELAAASKAQAQSATQEHLCNKNYIPGTLGAKECPSDLHIVDTQTMCTDAATAMGLARGGVAPALPFKIPDDQFNAFPKGCFKKNNDSTALWFNSGDNPADPSAGTAVCQRPKYKVSTGADCTAETGYESILDEDKCRSFALCTDKFCTSSREFFQVGVPAVSPADDHRPADQTGDFFDKRPEGCFIHPTTGCVHFNVPRADTKPSGAIAGTAACMASSGHHSTTTASTNTTTAAAAR